MQQPKGETRLAFLFEHFVHHPDLWYERGRRLRRSQIVPGLPVGYV